eukprot:TRINITY_DN5425_c0_g1_i2.p1 TRINITY_DN5425_c0_g1~~TRINITY_DN5425_c0_g1_i2.p1  ORF type:complete len:337 (+),score=83.31 TRINITY_DN5425_c0_g1_i2:763-1773(+)
MVHIGAHCDPSGPLDFDTQMLRQRVVAEQLQRTGELEAEREQPEMVPFGALKQRLLARFWLQHSERGAETEQLFFNNWHHYASLVLWKMQLLDSSHFLFKWGRKEDLASAHIPQVDPSRSTVFFSVYNFQTMSVVRVFDNTSPRLLAYFNNYNDYIRTGLPHGVDIGPTRSNNSEFREIFHRQIANPPGLSETAITRKTLLFLPISPQHSIESVLLDPHLFAYDVRTMSIHDRPKVCTDSPLKFFSRATNRLKFRLVTALAGPATKLTVSFVFHPVLPFVVSQNCGPVDSSVIALHFPGPHGARQDYVRRPGDLAEEQGDGHEAELDAAAVEQEPQ